MLLEALGIVTTGVGLVISLGGTCFNDSCLLEVV